MTSASDLVYTNIRTGEILGILPALEVGYTRPLNLPDSLSASLSLFDEHTIKATTDILTGQTYDFDSFTPGRVGVFLMRDGVILSGGLLMGAQVDVNSELVSINVVGLQSYLRRLIIRSAKLYNSQDQDTIARDLVSEASSWVNLTGVSNPHGVPRDRSYFPAQRKTVGAALEELAAVNNGFDFVINHSLDSVNNSISSTFQTIYPATGRESGSVFDMERVSSMKVALDASGLVNFADALGGVQGDDVIEGTATNTAMTANFPRYDQVTIHTDIQDQANLQAKAERAIDRGAQVAYRVTLTKDMDSAPSVGSLSPGDLAVVKANAGALQLDETMRITNISGSIGRNGQETQQVTLVSRSLFI